jgi:hypothetical protein
MGHRFDALGLMMVNPIKNDSVTISIGYPHRPGNAPESLDLKVSANIDRRPAESLLARKR